MWCPWIFGIFCIHGNMAKKNLFLTNSFFIFLRNFLMDILFFYYYLRCISISNCRYQLGKRIQKYPCGLVFSFVQQFCYHVGGHGFVLLHTPQTWGFDVCKSYAASLSLKFFKIKPQILPNTILAPP